MLVLSGPSQIRRAFARKIFRGLLIVGFALNLFVAAGTRQLGELFIGGFFLAKDFLQENRSLRVPQQTCPFVQATVGGHLIMLDLLRGRDQRRVDGGCR
jgi:hypothetical protein